MNENNVKSNDNKKSNGTKLTPQNYLDLWKYREDVSGRDKDRMVTIVTPLLTAAVIALGYIVKDNIDFKPYLIENPFQTVLFSSAVMVICVLSIFMVYAFSAYANRYWYMADRLRKDIQRLDVYDNKDGFREKIKDKMTKSKNPIIKINQTLILCLSKRHDPLKRLGTIFEVFLIFSLILVIISGVILACALLWLFNHTN